MCDMYVSESEESMGLCIWLQSWHESPDHFMVAGGRLVFPECGRRALIGWAEAHVLRGAKTEDL